MRTHYAQKSYALPLTSSTCFTMAYKFCRCGLFQGTLDCDVAIAGGGLSGLYMAYRLVQNSQNRSVCVFEKDSGLGGRLYDVFFDEAPKIAVGKAIPWESIWAIRFVPHRNTLCSFTTRREVYEKSTANKAMCAFTILCWCVQRHNWCPASQLSLLTTSRAV